jgi:hypothetical protein
MRGEGGYDVRESLGISIVFSFPLFAFALASLYVQTVYP